MSPRSRVIAVGGNGNRTASGRTRTKGERIDIDVVDADVVDTAGVPGAILIPTESDALVVGLRDVEVHVNCSRVAARA